MTERLLPPNASPLEQVLEDITAHRLNKLPVPLRDLWRPDTCPAPLLPWLAWALSVDQWDSQWPVAIQRQVIAQSVALHRHKGTVGALRRLMEAIGIHLTLTEWWQPEGSGTPHTFDVTAWASDSFHSPHQTFLTSEFYDRLGRTIYAIKPVRSHFKLRVGARFNQELGIGSQQQVSQSGRFTTRLTPFPVAGINRLRLAVTSSSMTTTRCLAHPIPKTNLNTTTLVTVGTYSARTIVRVRMEDQ